MTSMRHQRRRRDDSGIVMILIFAIFVVGGLPAWAGEREKTEIVACYEGGSISRQECRAWAEYKGLSSMAEPSPTLLQQIALVKTMAQAALQRGEGRVVDMAIEEQRRKLLVQALRRHMTVQYEVPEEQVEMLFRENPTIFDRPRKVLLRNIYIAFPQRADPEQNAAVHQRMHELHRQLEQGADFAALAEQESESHTRYDGGRIGFIAPGQLAPKIDSVIGLLAKGEISQVIEHGDGLTILKCESIAPAVVHSPEQTRELIRSQVRRHGINTGWALFKRQILKAAKPSYNLAAIRAADSNGPWVLEVKQYKLGVNELAEIAEARHVPPPAELPEEQLQQLLEEHALQLLLADHAEELGLTPPSMAQTLIWSRLEQLAQIELEQQVEHELHTGTEEEVRRYFTKNQDRFRHPARWHIAALQMAPSDDAEAVRQVSEEVHRLLGSITRGEMTFAEAARRHSGHPSAERGGDLGLLKAQQVAAFGPRVFRAIKGLQPGEITSVMRLETGFWIFTLLGTKAEQSQTWAEAAVDAKAELEQQMLRQRRRQVQGQVAERLRMRVVTGQEGEAGCDAAASTSAAAEEPAGGTGE